MTGDPYVSPLVDGPVWDEVVQIEPAGVEEVFDITVPTLHNFVANDFIVHNSTYARCGIIVNVTPLEPEWEGHVTLEFSNTTPLPAKIYANEGIAQMLFFRVRRGLRGEPPIGIAAGNTKDSAASRFRRPERPARAIAAPSVAAPSNRPARRVNRPRAWADNACRRGSES